MVLRTDANVPVLADFAMPFPGSFGPGIIPLRRRVVKSEMGFMPISWEFFIPSRLSHFID
jgi:hypothetical protein